MENITLVSRQREASKEPYRYYKVRFMVNKITAHCKIFPVDHYKCQEEALSAAQRWRNMVRDKHKLLGRMGRPKKEKMKVTITFINDWQDGYNRIGYRIAFGAYQNNKYCIRYRMFSVKNYQSKKAAKEAAIEFQESLVTQGTHYK